ncbi:MAG: branched-chain amino acid transport system / permease component family protein [Sphaerisporangium sp.]|nr:branched-chain amino acid transport system / permease component family protein [Sphaerisporangium sp.]
MQTATQGELAPPDHGPVLEATGIRKVFPGHVALDDVDLLVARGEVHAIVGQNGAGKSTLVKILTGVYTLDAGEIRLDGKPVAIGSPNDARALGIEIVHQDHPLVPQLDVTRNAFLGRERLRGGVLDLSRMRAETAEALKTIGARFSPDTLARDLTVAERMQAAIAAALTQQPKILILDEPTASLSMTEAEKLFEVIRSVKAAGVTIVYISHRLGEITSLATHVTVLRDGRRVGMLSMAESSRQDMIRMMVGRDLSQLYPRNHTPAGDVVLDVKDWHVGDHVRGVDLTVRRGEIVGLAGLVGSGCSELALSIFGADKPTGGTATVAGQAVGGHGPRRNMRRGVALVPEDRRSEAVFETLTLRENISLSNLGAWSTGGWVRRGRERREAARLLDQLHVSATGTEQQVGELSGGNQQKVVIGRWLARGAELYIFDEPTAGVDVGSKVEIYRQINDLVAGGAGVLMISSDFDELRELCDRVLVVVEGKVTREVAYGEADLAQLTYWAAGGDDAQAKADAADARALPGHRPLLSRMTSARSVTISAMILILLVIGVMAPNFLQPGNLLDVLKQGSVTSLIAIALTSALAVGGFDLSVGATSQLVANVTAGAVIGGMAVPSSLVVGVLIGAAVGLVNGVTIVLLRVPSFVATLGMLFLLMGVTLQVNGGLTRTVDVNGHVAFLSLGQGYIGPVPVALVIVALVSLVMWILLKRTSWGLRLYAVGGSPQAAAIRGVSARRLTLLAFLLSGAVAGLAGVIQASYSSGSTASDSSLGVLVAALSAAFLGSTISASREFDVVGTAIAAMFVSGVANGLILTGLSNLVLPGVQGAILVAAVLVAVIRERRLGQVAVF